VLANLDKAARQADRVGDAQMVAPVTDGRSEYDALVEPVHAAGLQHVDRCAAWDATDREPPAP
jgi:hypothetical protein